MTSIWKNHRSSLKFGLSDALPSSIAYLGSKFPVEFWVKLIASATKFETLLSTINHCKHA